MRQEGEGKGEKEAREGGSGGGEGGRGGGGGGEGMRKCLGSCHTSESVSPQD